MIKYLFFLFFILSLIPTAFALESSGKLLLTGGVSSLEGAAGGGVTPWAFIGGYGTRDQVGGSTYYTNTNISDYKLESYGALVGIFDRVELSAARQTLDTQRVGTKLGLGRDFKIRQDILGIKVKLLGDGVLEQASWLPQISFGALMKQNKEGAVVRSLGAAEERGVDYYLAASKIILSQSLLVSATVRRTKANQMGLLGFGGDSHNRQQYLFEGSLAYLIRRNLALGMEYRMKPSNLKIVKEDSWSDLFMAWAPTKNISLTFAYTMLGNIAIKDHQSGIYSSLQLGF
jgi:hypothetical protein